MKPNRFRFLVSALNHPCTSPSASWWFNGSFSRKGALSLSLGFAVVGMSTHMAQAAPENWTGVTNGLWGTNTNWSGSTTPTTVDDLTILGPGNAAGALNINVAAAAFANTINITNTAATTLTNTTSGANQTLTLQSGLTTDTGAVTIGSATVNQGVLIDLGASQTWNIGAGGLTAANVISGSGFGITKTGAGTLILSGANTYTGVTTIGTGILNVGSLANGGSASNIGASTSAAANLVFDGGTLRYTSATGFVQTNRAFTINSGKTATIDFANSVTLAIEGATGTATTGALTKTGGGLLVLTGANTYTGKTTISGGTLQIGTTSERIADSSVVEINNGAKFEIQAFTETIGGLTTTTAGQNSLVQNKESSSSGLGTLIINTAGNDHTFDGIVRNRNSGSGTLAIQKSGAGTQTFTNTSNVIGYTFSGGLTINTNGGTLKLRDNGNGKTIGAFASAVTVNSGGTFALENTLAANTQTFARVISGAGAVEISSGNVGTVTLNQANTYTGATTINSGTLALASTGSIANSSEIAINGGNFNVSAVSGFSLGAGKSLTGSGGSVTGDITVNGTLAIGNSPGTMTFNDDLTIGSPAISNFEFTDIAFGINSYDLAQSGTGTQTVTFGGTLNLFFSGGTYADNSSVRIFDFETYSGGFGAVNFTGLGIGQSATFDDATGYVTVIPEPAACLLGGVGMLFLLRRRRH